MPRLIDHDHRRAELAEAVWRIIARDGLEAVSVRHVAAEAGVSAGSLRHVLPTKADLLTAAMELVVERAAARFRARADRPVPDRAAVLALLTELLPLDEERSLELRTHLALVLGSPGHPELVRLRATLDDALRQGCRAALDLAAAAGLLRPDLDLDLEALRLAVVVDGLALHLLGPGADLEPTAAEAVLDGHLAALGP
ncbi:TetR/AcrR family transcriptional regulator [Nocardioides litoris]|uniref:TetR/AcrR family transcriptional regulator n=1 Tax=Nocardioides litoris TaxID=1926648 RepID=UPI001477776B|nr:TetR family transcriptional regulator C-terminal domain-containing protein [Nocardioides litoris]